MKVVPIEMSKGGSNYGLPTFKKDAKPLFQIQPKENGAEWMDGDGKAIAVEDRSDEGQHKLIITASLHRETVDALVALWCGRVWQYSAENKEALHEGMEGGKFRERSYILVVADILQSAGSSDCHARPSPAAKCWLAFCSLTLPNTNKHLLSPSIFLSC